MKVLFERERLHDRSYTYGVRLFRDVEELYIPCRDKEEADILEKSLTHLINKYSAECVDKHDWEVK